MGMRGSCPLTLKSINPAAHHEFYDKFFGREQCMEWWDNHEKIQDDGAPSNFGNLKREKILRKRAILAVNDEDELGLNVSRLLEGLSTNNAFLNVLALQVKDGKSIDEWRASVGK